VTAMKKAVYTVDPRALPTNDDDDRTQLDAMCCRYIVAYD